MKPARHPRLLPLAAALCAAAVFAPAHASSHREAPFITTAPKVDGTDWYMFMGYESGRENFVTLIANYVPLQAPYGGPNYFKLDPNALYEMHIDNNGDAKEDITFQFRFKNNLRATALDIGGKMVPIPLTQSGPVTAPNAPTLNVNEQFSVDIVRGDRRTGTRASITNASGGSATFDKPADNIGTKTIPDYAAYAAQHVYSVNVPGCATPGRLFVGQRQEGFAVNLGPIFDLVNAPVAVITNPEQINAAAANSIQDSNVTSLALEVHRDCLAPGTEKVIGGWTTASLRQGRLLNGAPPKGHQTSEITGGAWTQVSRLGHPLVNEVVIGLPDKDRFNGSKPSGDLQFADYVTNPTLPALLEIALNLPGGVAPTNFPRTDLLNVFLTGIATINKPASVTPAEMLRLNTAIPPRPFAQQNRLGIAGEVLRKGGAGQLDPMTDDLAGFPNGRRPKDDVTDIALVAVAGGLCVINSNANLGQLMPGDNQNVLGLNSFVIPGNPATTLTSECRVANVPLGATSAALHDAVDQAVVPFLPGFPYLNTPLPGAQ